jgi:hypothetical protein
MPQTPECWAQRAVAAMLLRVRAAVVAECLRAAAELRATADRVKP